MTSRHCRSPTRSIETGDVAILVLAILHRPVLVAEHQGAEECLAHPVVGEDQPDIALRTGQLVEPLQRPVLSDRAGERWIGNVIEHPLTHGSKLGHPAAIAAIGDRRIGQRAVGIEQATFARKLAAMARGAGGSDRGRERLAPVAQPLAVSLGGDLAPRRGRARHRRRADDLHGRARPAGRDGPQAALRSGLICLMPRSIRRPC